MLRIVQFLACLAVLNQVNCFFNPLASLLLDSPAMLPFDEVLEETKMLAAVKQMGGGDLEDVLLAPFGQIQVPEQQQQQQQQQQLQLQQQQQQQLTRKQQRQQQQQLEQQRQQELEREQEQRKRQQQEQEQRTQQQQQQQREQQQKQQQREQRRQQKEQQLKQDQQKTEQQLQQQQKLQQQQQPKQIKQLDQLQIQVLDQDGQERLEGRVSQNEEILHDFVDLKQRMDYIRDKIVRTIQVAKSQIEDHQRQADKQIQTLVLEQQRLQQQIRLLEQQREQQQQLQQLQLPEQQQQDELMMLRARSPLSRLSDELIMPRRMFQTDRMLDAMMPVPIVAMKIDTIDQISPLSLLNQISNSIMQNPLLPLSKQSEAQSCDQVHGKAMDAHRENRIRIQHTLIKQTTYRFESSTCQCQQQQQQQQQQLQQQQQQTLEHCSLAYSRPDQQTCKVVELNNRQQQAFASNCEALEACRAQGAQCDGVYHDGAKYYLIECKQQGQRIATRPGLGAEYIIQLRSCF